MVVLFPNGQQAAVGRNRKRRDRLGDDRGEVAPGDELLDTRVSVVDSNIMPNGVEADSLINETHVVVHFALEAEKVHVC